MALSPRTTLYRGSLITFTLLLMAYGTYEAYDLIAGPSLTITSPKNGALVTDSLVTIEGQTRNVSWISFLGRPITINEHGMFTEKLLLPPGYSILTLEAKDRLGRRITQEVTLVRAGTEITATAASETLGTSATTTSELPVTQTP